MNKVFEKIIEKLEEEKMSYFLTIANTGDEKLDCAYEHTGDALDKAIEIVKQEAEQYNNAIIDGNYCFQSCACTEKCDKCSRLCNGDIDWYENIDNWTEQYNNGWIPCSERMPEEDEKVYISTKTERVYVGVYTKRYGFEKREGFICDDGFMWMNTALAWKPYVLPDPYKPNGEIDECRNG